MHLFTEALRILDTGHKWLTRTLAALVVVLSVALIWCHTNTSPEQKNTRGDLSSSIIKSR